MNYAYNKRINGQFADVLEKTKLALKEQGFGILWEIDVKATMKEKINEDYDNYMILGACNPPLAHQALQAEKEIGLFLPCNVVVYQNEEEVVVSVVLPTAVMGVVGNSSLDDMANMAESKLKAAIDNI